MRKFSDLLLLKLLALKIQESGHAPSILMYRNHDKENRDLLAWGIQYNSLGADETYESDTRLTRIFYQPRKYLAFVSKKSATATVISEFSC